MTYQEELRRAKEELGKASKAAAAAAKHVDNAAGELLRPGSPADIRSRHATASKADEEVEKAKLELMELGLAAKTTAGGARTIDKTADRVIYGLGKLCAGIREDAKSEEQRRRSAQVPMSFTGGGVRPFEPFPEPGEGDDGDGDDGDDDPDDEDAAPEPAAAPPAAAAATTASSVTTEPGGKAKAKARTAARRGSRNKR